jgi:hypothetical protein
MAVSGRPEGCCYYTSERERNGDAWNAFEDKICVSLPRCLSAAQQSSAGCKKKEEKKYKKNKSISVK